MSFRRGQRIDDIEALRAIAIVFVLIAHRNNLLVWRCSRPSDSALDFFNFSIGVDLFLSVSGFIIVRGIEEDFLALPAIETLPNLISFWIKRFWRLAPTAWLWITIAVLCAFFFNQAGNYGPPDVAFESAIASLANVMNFRTAYIEAAGKTSYALTVFWSLSLEEQFYVLLPLSMLLFRTKKRFLLFAFSLVFVQFAIPFRSSNLYLFFCKTDGLFLGVIIGLVSRDQLVGRLRYCFEPTFLKHGAARIVFLCAMIILAAGIKEPLIQLNVISIIAAALVWVASYNADYLCRNACVKQCLIWVGARSYSIYVIHCVVFKIPAEIWWRTHDDPQQHFDSHLTWYFIPIGIALTVICAELNYRFLEQPLRLKGRQIANAYLKRCSNTDVVENKVAFTHTPTERASLPQLATT